MAKGKITRIANIDRKFGAADTYLFLKVDADFSASAEEYLMLTDDEFVDAATRGEMNPEDVGDLSRGVLTLRQNTERRFGAAAHYYAVRVRAEGGDEARLLFTESGLERIRQRVENNAEDVAANKTGWLADLFD